MGEESSRGVAIPSAMVLRLMLALTFAVAPMAQVMAEVAPLDPLTEEERQGASEAALRDERVVELVGEEGLSLIHI